MTGPYPARETASAYSDPEMVHTAVGSLRSHVWYELENLNGRTGLEVDDAVWSYLRKSSDRWLVCEQRARHHAGVWGGCVCASRE